VDHTHIYIILKFSFYFIVIENKYSATVIWKFKNLNENKYVGCEVKTTATEECIFICDSYVKCDSAHICCREFQHKFPGVDISARSAIHYLVNKLKTAGLELADSQFSYIQLVQFPKEAGLIYVRT
jgi:hypothetical protein